MSSLSTNELKTVDGTKSVQVADIATFVVPSGDTIDRPSTPKEGQHFFDSELGMPIWFHGTEWVDATGTGA